MTKDTEEYFPAMEEKDLKEGTMKQRSIEGVPILIIKQQGKIFVIDDRCPHMGCRLSSGKLEGIEVVCPCHEWRFNLNTGEYQDEPAIKVIQYQWKIQLGKILVKID